MQKFYLAIFATLLSIASTAQILREETTPQTISTKIPGYAEITSINTVTVAYTPPAPPPDPVLIQDDTTHMHSGTYDYGTILPVSFSLADGNFTTTSAGKVWTLRISVPNALSIGLTFTQFNLSPSAELYIYNEAKTAVNLGIKKEHFIHSDTVVVSSMNGNGIILYLLEPSNFGTFQSNLIIGELVGGYQSIADVGDSSNTQGAQLRTLNCIPEVQCYQAHMFSARAVARMQIPKNSTTVGLCTGTLINNEQNNGHPYLLTAFHCVDINENNVIDAAERDALRRATFRFQYWMAQCSGSRINNRAIDFTGAEIIASNRATDMVLLELINPPGIGDGVNYAGWSRQTYRPSDEQSYVIHHPKGLDMRHNQTSGVGTAGWKPEYWAASYEVGTTYGGSSGSALFNEWGQLIGQLWGGWTTCAITFVTDVYGKFYLSWAEANLGQWLSPMQNLQSTGTLNLTNISITGPEFLQCTNPQQYSTIGGLEGATYDWIPSSGLQILSGQGTGTVTIAALNNAPQGQTLTAILRSPNKGRNREVSITKYINVNQGSVIGWYNSPVSSSQPLQPFTRFSPAWNDACSGTQINTSMQITSGSAVVWEDAGSTPGVTWWQSGNNLSFYFSDAGQEAYFRVEVTNTCGTKRVTYRFRPVTEGCSGVILMMALSPNPTTGDTRVSLHDKDKPDNKKDIRHIKIIDKLGNVLRQMSFGAGNQNPVINTTGLQPDIYTVVAFGEDNRWASAKLAVQ